MVPPIDHDVNYIKSGSKRSNQSSHLFTLFYSYLIYSTFHRAVSHMQEPTYFGLEESRDTSLFELLPLWSDKGSRACSAQSPSAALVVISCWNQSHGSTNSSDSYGFRGFAPLPSGDGRDFHSD